MTAKVLGWQLGMARAVGAVVFSVVIGLLMHLIFLKEERQQEQKKDFNVCDETQPRALWQNALFFAAMVGFLVFVNWSGDKNGQGLGSKVAGFK